MFIFLFPFFHSKLAEKKIVLCQKQPFTRLAVENIESFNQSRDEEQSAPTSARDSSEVSSRVSSALGTARDGDTSEIPFSDAFASYFDEEQQASPAVGVWLTPAVHSNFHKMKVCILE